MSSHAGCRPMWRNAFPTRESYRRSGASGFFIPLSGGADSSAVATIVFSMASLVFQQCAAGNVKVLDEVERVTGRKRDEKNYPQNAKQLCRELLHTAYLGTSNSSSSTMVLSQSLASQVGAYHLTASLDSVIKVHVVEVKRQPSAVFHTSVENHGNFCLLFPQAVLGVFQFMTAKQPKFLVDGGTQAEDLALQNVQARLRMVISYLLASLLPWCRGKRGYLLVLGTGNVDESLRGYLTKYDCSSGDINPIGSISKVDLKKFLVWAADELNLPCLWDICKAPPTAELRPLESGADIHSQTDEADMGMTYDELSLYGRLRKTMRCGPVSMFKNLVHEWKEKYGLAEIARKVKHFFTTYAQNRHKMTVLTPSYHAETYSPDDNRFDHRPFLYPTGFSRQFQVIDELSTASTAEAT